MIPLRGVYCLLICILLLYKSLQAMVFGQEGVRTLIQASLFK